MEGEAFWHWKPFGEHAGCLVGDNLPGTGTVPAEAQPAPGFSKQDCF